MPPQIVVAAGAHNLSGLAPSPLALKLLRQAYRSAVRDVYIFALAAGAVAFLFSLGFEHRNVRIVSEERKVKEGTMALDKPTDEVGDSGEKSV